MEAELYNDVNCLLLKPDGNKSEQVRTLVRKMLKLANLEVIASFDRILTPDEVVTTWPVFSTDMHPMSKAISQLYMTSGPSKVILVRGEGSIEKCLKIKAEIRKKFEICAFENAIHSPVDEMERSANIEWFAHSNPITPKLDWPEWGKRGRFGRALMVPSDEIQEIARSIWCHKEEGGWSKVFNTAEKIVAGTVDAVLWPGDPNSIDYGISALFESVILNNYELSVRKFLEAEVRGRAVIYRGSLAGAEIIRSKLLQHRINVTLEFDGKIVRP